MSARATGVLSDETKFETITRVAQQVSTCPLGADLLVSAFVAALQHYRCPTGVPPLLTTNTSIKFSPPPELDARLFQQPTQVSPASD